MYKPPLFKGRLLGHRGPGPVAHSHPNLHQRVVRIKWRKGECLKLYCLCNEALFAYERRESDILKPTNFAATLLQKVISLLVQPPCDTQKV